MQTETENEVSAHKLKDGSTANVEPIGVDLEVGKQGRSAKKSKQELGIIPYTTPGENDSIVIKKPQHNQNKTNNISKYSDLESVDIDPRSKMLQLKGEAPSMFSPGHCKNSPIS